MMLASAERMLASTPLTTALADFLDARALRCEAMAALDEACADTAEGTRLATVARVATVVHTVFFLYHGFSSSVASSA
jgi:hypothetical protein